MTIWPAEQTLEKKIEERGDYSTDKILDGQKKIQGIIERGNTLEEVSVSNSVAAVDADWVELLDLTGAKGILTSAHVYAAHGGRTPNTSDRLTATVQFIVDGQVLTLSVDAYSTTANDDASITVNISKEAADTRIVFGGTYTDTHVTNQPIVFNKSLRIRKKITAVGANISYGNSRGTFSASAKYMVFES